MTNEAFRREVLCSKRGVVVEFTTDWCGTSHLIAPILHDMVVESAADLKLCRVDVEESEELAKQYGIGRVPTVLFFWKGTVVDFAIGAVSREGLASKLSQLTLREGDPS